MEGLCHCQMTTSVLSQQPLSFLFLYCDRQTHTHINTHFWICLHTFADWHQAICHIHTHMQAKGSSPHLNTPNIVNWSTLGLISHCTHTLQHRHILVNKAKNSNEKVTSPLTFWL